MFLHVAELLKLVLLSVFAKSAVLSLIFLSE